jgi:outer membrane protein OmpA-like peptidoglycan-associated protein
VAPSFDEFNGARESGENVYKLGASAGAGVRYGLVGSLAAQVEILYATRGTDVALDGMTAGSFYLSYIEMPVLLHYVIWRVPGVAEGRQRSPLAVHLAAGPGVSYLLSAVRDDFSGKFELSRSVVREWDVSAIAGLGVTWDVTPHWAASFEVRYDVGFIDTFPNVQDDRETRNRAILFTLGIGYTFNDADGDGVIGSRDRCRTQREDWNGFEDHDGCPDTDDDRDGVRGDADACPEQPEDINAYKDRDGCPDADTDEDGDGLIAREDACPDQAFPYNKRLTHARRGCPPGFKGVIVEGDRIQLDPSLIFAFGGSDLTQEQRATLDDVVELLKKYYPEMRLRIEGHADSRTGGRSQKLNQEESQKRALAVESYLIAQGIQPDRLVARGYGEDKPSYTDNPVTGQQGNRRVELIIIDNPEPR